jgi:hypothetical protein
LLDFCARRLYCKYERILAARTGHRCSNPGCRQPTIGPGSEDTIINIGVAAHITAASPGTRENPGPRYDKTLTKEIADADIVLSFVRNYARLKRPFDGNLAHAIREIAVGKRPVADWPNAYNEFSVSLATLRKQLFAIIMKNGAESALAEACLNEIEELRYEYGRINDEPRHPDIASGHTWPSVV